MSINMIKKRVSELQERLGCELQVTIYNSGLNSRDDLLSAAKDCRMSIIAEGGSEWQPGKESTSVYGVRVIAEEFGEIPYALLAETVYVEGKKEGESPAFSDHTLAMASLTTAVTSSLDPDQLYKFLVAAKEKGKITDEQFLLATKHFLSTEEEESCVLV